MIPPLTASFTSVTEQLTQQMLKDQLARTTLDYDYALQKQNSPQIQAFNAQLGALAQRGSPPLTQAEKAQLADLGNKAGLSATWINGSIAQVESIRAQPR